MKNKILNLANELNLHFDITSEEFKTIKNDPLLISMGFIVDIFQLDELFAKKYKSEYNFDSTSLSDFVLFKFGQSGLDKFNELFFDFEEPTDEDELNIVEQVIVNPNQGVLF